MGRTFRTLLAAVALLLIAACHKEGDGRVELILEPMNGNGAKLVIGSDNVSGTWSDGDVISFNGTRVGITREDNTHAYISDANSRSVNSACFPATMSDGDLSGSSVTMTLPSTYHYALSNGRQRLDLPMAARAAEGEPLRFRHLTAALSVVIRNDRSETLVIDSLVVGSDSYRLCGDYSVNMDALSSLSPQALNGAADSSVTMVFDRQRLELAPGDTVMVMVPVLPVGEGNRFTITVSSRYQGKRYRYVKPQRTGGSLPRNTLAYAPMSLNASPRVTTNLFRGTYSSVDSPMEISSPIDLIILSEACNNGWSLRTLSARKYYEYSIKFTQDIDMSGITIAPIANYIGKTVDGNNKTISNLSISTNGDTCGLFTSLDGVQMGNLTLDNIKLISHATGNIVYVGGICGQLKSSSELNNCNISGCFDVSCDATTTINMGSIAGGSIGNTPLLSNCTCNYNQELNLTANQLYYGGLIGYCEYYATGSSSIEFNNCHVVNQSLAITNSKKIYQGGLIGSNARVTINLKGCRWTGNSTIESINSSLYVGGLVGSFTSVGNLSLSLTGNTPCDVGGHIVANAQSTSYLGYCIGQYLPQYLATSANSTITNISSNATLILNGDTIKNKKIGNQ